MKEGLLDEIATELRTQCLSDMKGQRFQIRHIIRHIPIGEYSLKEWRECANYLDNNNKQFQSEKEVRDYLTR